MAHGKDLTGWVRHVLWVVVVLLGAATIVNAAEPLFIQSTKAKILANPKFSAPVLIEVAKGTSVDPLEQQGSWYRVRYQDKEGWLSKLLVASYPPMEKQGAIQADSEIGTHARRRASAVATAGAARGLAAEDRKRTVEGGLANYPALAEMENLKVTDSEAVDFLQRGFAQ
ncbi:MAG: SH3 domain-containing protein [Proteobacteria bacterium]|nr:SH3 domain-containing protein [Pseudomonadota bacterium]MBU1687662.1 SH3 domain-containing protein [Pseudomonadota bacterium]